MARELLIMVSSLFFLCGCETSSCGPSLVDEHYLYEKGKIILDESLQDSARIDAAKEYCERIDKLLCERKEIPRKIVLKTFDATSSGRNERVCGYMLRLKNDGDVYNAYSISIYFRGNSVVRAYAGFGFE